MQPAQSPPPSQLPAYQQYLNQIGPAVENATPQYLQTMKNIPRASFADNAQAGPIGNFALGTAQGIINIPHNILGGSTRLGEQLGNGLSGNGFNWRQVGQGGLQLANGFLSGLTAQGALAGAQGAWNATPFSEAGANRGFQAAQEVERAAGNLSSEGFVKDAQGAWRDPTSGQFAQPQTLPQQPNQLPQYMLKEAPPSEGRALGGMDLIQKGASRIGRVIQ